MITSQGIAKTVYDTIKIKKQLDQLPKEVLRCTIEPFYWGNSLWLPSFNKYGDVVKYYTDMNNLRLKLRGHDLFIENSLQKFYMGNNYQDFIYSQVVEAFHKLNTVLPFSIYDASIIKLSTGVVIQEEAQPIFESWLEYKGKSPRIMTNRNTVYGAYFQATNYKIKGYDKTFEVKQHNQVSLYDNYFRFELEAYSRHFTSKSQPIHTVTVQDLMSKSTFNALADNLFLVYEDIKKKPFYNYQQMSPKDIRLLATMVNTETANGLKKYHQHTYKKDRKTYLKLLKENDNNKLDIQVLQQLKDKIEYSKH